jgi:hypothetical protein
MPFETGRAEGQAERAKGQAERCACDWAALRKVRARALVLWSSFDGLSLILAHAARKHSVLWSCLS